ncbi:aminodeoxychorismate synthase component I [Nitrosococcus watsonii]|uniref:aminodeoxychorismate synthase n=1 Tax=Nitrosococcus watsoni (strain C-113) TaxID=105559 RepID=D8K9N4_NITWC|nr:aminodeoxychorismate synthase component I [Nitrosococcus watsonii]ADJ27323.1 para-aminobenzoate synthase, subunit I [Nitrosococcus watsonii C-113]
MKHSPRYAELPYSEDSTPLFEAIRQEPWAIFLDSGWPANQSGRFDILAADPFMTFSCWGSETTIRKRHESFSSFENPFTLLQSELRRYTRNTSSIFPELPLTGGAMGYFGYDLGRRIEQLPTLALDIEGMPEMAIGLYDWVIVVDHRQQRSLLVGQGYDYRTWGRWEALQSHLSQCHDSPPSQTTFRLWEPIESNLKQKDYQQAFTSIQHYIREGDCYQVNLAQRFEALAQGDPWALYRRLRLLNAAPFSAYFTIPEGAVLSTSPERFLRTNAGGVESHPIKGTRPRNPDPIADRKLALELQNSPKDRAENVMIVDLLRNDLGRVCLPGAIHVPRLCAIESFATVHHLVSTIRGRLTPGQDSIDLLQACFPGGSVTGAPKVRAMEIIEELEPHRRGVYCGSLGYIGFDGNMDTSIAIRTLVYNQNYLRFWAGGGIVADSVAEVEYQETLDKAAAILRALGEYTTPASNSVP